MGTRPEGRGRGFHFYATQWLEAERVYLDIQLIDPEHFSGICHLEVTF